MKQADGAIPTLSNYSRKSEEDLFICCTSVSNQLYSRVFLFIRSFFTLFCGLGWSSMKQTTPIYTQLEQDGGKKTTWALGFFWRWRGWEKMEPFTVKWLCLCSRSWMFGGRNQSGRWDLLIHPFGPGSSCHLQRAVPWTLFPQANSYSRK